jgi:hypothetical protein
LNCSTLSPNCAVLKYAAHSAHSTTMAALTSTACHGCIARADGNEVEVVTGEPMWGSRILG